VTTFSARLLATISAAQRARAALQLRDWDASRSAIEDAEANYERLDDAERQIYDDVISGRLPDPTAEVLP
jgi:primosomal protein N''